ncbi:PREDICTED: inactive protein RESTRICTED TEV MOVEMENT 1-like [Tarenaya hassleriana]|uniref:inactive protein RESTRICTED TEV MOVEMENT 1-like n=1 Tax=Tarenaya hassleriana TaxID=28532 RepID=UPI00053C247A|nr:PREDICTED: inactive protein RESTRICTED TEV MOVEMENT 1-like [Tarenaya hassleriana]
MSGIRTIRFQYIEDGKLVLSNPYGGDSSNQYYQASGTSPCPNALSCHTIELDHPKEYLIGVSGRAMVSGARRYPNIIALAFTTNLKEYGPFGRPHSLPCEEFRFDLGKSRQFGGFYGSYNAYGLHRIGVYLKPKSTIVKEEKP